MQRWLGIKPDHLDSWNHVSRLMFEKGIRQLGLCPSCGGAKLRFFFWRHRLEDPDAGDKGGFWIWCPSCHQYEHSSCLVPAWWKDVPDVPDLALEHQPDRLDQRWESIIAPFLKTAG